MSRTPFVRIIVERECLLFTSSSRSRLGKCWFARSYSIEFVLDLLKGLAFRFGQQKYREEDTDNAEHSEYPEQHVLAERVLEVAAKLGDEKGQEPA